MNLFLGLCKGVAGLPRDFYHLGYSDKWIECSFTNQKGETVVPELMISSERCGHTILFEWKAGANTTEEQLRRYAGVTATDLVTKAFLTTAESSQHDVCVIGKDEHRDRLPLGVTRGGFSFPVLVVTTDGLEKVFNRFSNPDLETLFDPTYAIDFSAIPTYLFPIDKDSDLWEFAEVILPVLIEWMHAGKSRILLDEIAATVVPTWSIVDPQYRRDCASKIERVLDLAARREFKRYLRKNRQAKRKTHTATYDIVFNPVSLAPTKRYSEWRHLQRQQAAFMESLMKGITLPIQGELFE